MINSQKLSLSQAILININIMMGAGIFINSIPLTKLAGILSPLVYLSVGLLMLPLVLGISKLLKYFPGGSFYNYAKNTIGTVWGFLAAWSYFIGKLASATLTIHFFAMIIQQLFPIMTNINIFLMDGLIINLFMILNLLNLKTGSRIQFTFMIFKAIPILFVILTGLFLLQGQAFVANLHLDAFVFAAPLVIYAFTGFEACCSLSRHIKNPEKNAAVAVLISYLIVITILTLYQLLFYTSVYQDINNVHDYTQALPTLINRINLTFLSTYLRSIFQIAIGLSALGGSYGILFSNSWNLFILAENNHLLGAKKLIQLNKNNIPTFCVAVEALFCIFYLILSRGNNIILQQITALGCTLAYTISIVSLMWIKKYKIISYLAFINCIILLSFCIKSLIEANSIALITFTIILALGISMYFYTYLEKHNLK
jgi:amino acid transporter